MSRRGRVQARYAVQEEVASGGMGVVYRVLDRATGQVRALKRLSEEGATQRVFVEAFEREYHVLASLDHPRIIRVFDYGVDEEGPFYTMELLEGEALRNVAPVPYRQACLYLRDVGTCLALLHARRLIHRDLSPRNVVLTSDGQCKLLDFGALCAFGRSNLVMGTPPAIPPEALDGAPLDQRADLYSLGALAYWVLTGRHAFPTRQSSDLPLLWLRAPPPPSAIVEGIPEELDALVLALLRRDPLARPSSAAEVIARLTSIGELPAEDATEADRFAQSFLLNPRFTGRSEELQDLQQRISDATNGYGSAVCIQAAAGMGRTRLLEEVFVRAQLAGATVIRVDASMHRQVQGTTRAVVRRLLDTATELAREATPRLHHVLALLGGDLDARLSGRASVPSNPTTRSSVPPEDTHGRAVEDWLVEVSATRPLVLEVDNIEYADPASLGFLASVARLAGEHAILLVVTERLSRGDGSQLGLNVLKNHAARMTLTGLTEGQVCELVRSLFGDAPNVERFADWLHARTAGSPLHAVEICRQLAAKQVIRYSGGLWTLPIDRPDAELPAALGDALSMRLDSLGDEARALAECLSLQREQPTLELCRRLLSSQSKRQVLALLDELARNDVLHSDSDGFGFSSTALREALLARMDDARRDQNHRRLGEALLSFASSRDPALTVQAGWHLIRGGEEVRGADLIASVAADSVTIRTLMANLHRAGEPIEAALLIYRRQRRSVYERMPLLGALAQAGYYEERTWGERYGDEALDTLADLSGLGTARRYRRYLGRFLALVFGLVGAMLRFGFTPKNERRYSFKDVLVHLFSTVTTLAGAAALSLDSERSARVAQVLSPFLILPKRTTPAGIALFCESLQEIGRDNEAEAYERFDTLISRFESPKYYPTLPGEARQLYIAGAHFSRASFAIFRADGRGALESAQALERTGLKLYAMVASQIRFLYYMYRGEFPKAAPHREEVELHAAQVGSLWQVETWEAPALILIHTVLNDVVASTRVAQQLELLSRTVPSLKRHGRLAQLALKRTRNDVRYRALQTAEMALEAPRSYIGWAAAMAYLAQDHNDYKEHARAKELCETALGHISDADREYVSHCLNLDLQLAIADAGLSDTQRGLARLDGLRARFETCDHPLVHGLIHEARARICWQTGDISGYEESLAQVERRFRPTGTPALIAKCEQLARLGAARLAGSRTWLSGGEAGTLASADTTVVDGGETEVCAVDAS